MYEPEQLLILIEARMRELGMSQSQLGQRAFGKPDNTAIQSLKKGSSPAIDRLGAMAEALGWEVYFGPPRETGAVTTLTLDTDDFARIPVHEATLAAGDGASNGAELIVDHLAFRRTWLAHIGVSASNAVIARARGDSMLPLIHCGDLILIDRSRAEVPVSQRTRTDRRPSPIYAFLDEGNARVKRIERPEKDLAMLLSDNPAFGPEILSGARFEALEIIGRVVWWGHTNIE